MATAQKLPEASSLSPAMATNYTTCKTDGAISGQFPAGLRVLVVDDDLACLKILEQMLRKCLYTVTTCSCATTALSLLREKMGGFDIVISDVHMPDMDGFKLLEHVGLEMDLPVIMMSADGRTSVVMRGIKHGACDYLIKPVRMEELKNIWQHVVRKKWNECKELEHSGSVEDTERHRPVGDDTEYASSVKEGTDGNWKVQKKRRDVQEDDGELDNEDPSTTKKPRVVWSVELHQQFVSAVNQLGIDKAVPKRILELMNVPGLTRENVASHLQKFRLYLKRLSGEAQRQDATIGSFCGPVESNAKLSSLVRCDLQVMAASGQISPETLAVLHDELLGRPTGSLMLAGMDQPVLVQPSPQGSKCIPVEHGLAFGQPILKCHSSVSKQFHQPTVSIGDNTSAFPTWQRNQHGMPCFIGNMGGLNMQNSNRFMQTLNPSKQQPSLLLESSHTINVQPSCLIAPSESANSFQPGKNTVLTNQRSSFNSGTVVDFSPLPSQSNNISLGVQQVSDRDFKDVGVLNGCSVPDVSITSPMSSGLIGSERSTCWQVLNAGMGINSSSRVAGPMPNVCEIPASHSMRTTVLPEQGQGRNLGFVGKGTRIPSRFAVDDIESATGDLSHVKTCSSYDGERVKHELRMDFTENAKAGIHTLQHFSSGDLMSVVSK